MKSLIFIPLLLGAVLTFGQSANNWEFSIGYSGGNFVHPGMNISLERSIWEKTVSRSQERVIQRSLMAGANLGFYYHKNYQTGTWVQAQLGWRRLKEHTPTRKYRTFALGLGYLASWVPNSFLVEENQIDYRPFKTYSHFLIAPSVEWGSNFKTPKSIFSGWYVRPKIQVHLPYFQGSNQYFLLETGLKF